MIRIEFMPSFLRQLRTMSQDLQEEVIEKTELFKDTKNHKKLKLHKLNGRFASYHAFSVNYQVRIILKFIKKDFAVFLNVGSHDVYR
jgi:mRNA-degrading endonuclease YafQ of YafQ-DinJ toxin-antitoxin module